MELILVLLIDHKSYEKTERKWLKTTQNKLVPVYLQYLALFL